jgi:hypothetical protein
MKDNETKLEEFTVSPMLLGRVIVTEEVIKQFTKTYSKLKGCYYTSFKKGSGFGAVWIITNKFDGKIINSKAR